jgi:hypothetical protein
MPLRALSLFFVLLLSYTAAGAQDRVSVRVRVRSTSPDAPSYVALVPPHHPWRQPLAEKLTSGAAATFSVPPGRYRVLASAPGHGVVTLGPLLVSADARNDYELTLPPLERIRGVVRDVHGKPVPNATIADVNALIEAPLGRLSELAMQHFGASWRTTSASDGSWSLALPADASNPLVAEAPGHAAAWRANSRGGDAPVELLLGAGGALRVALDRRDPAFIVTLTQSGGTAPIPAAWQPQYWARRTVQPQLEWPSLATGTYDLYAQHADPRAFVKAVKLASVTIEPGTEREIKVALPPAQAAAANATSLFLDTIPRGRMAGLEAFGRDAAGLPKRIRHAVEEVSGGLLLHLNSAEASAPFFAVSNDAFIQPEDGNVAAITDLAGGSLRVVPAEPSLPLPRTGTVAFHQCNQVENVAVPVAVGKEGHITFPAPAGCTAFVVSFPPFAPLVFTRGLPAGDPAWLGDYRLYAAARAAVRVVSADDAPVANALVSVTASSAPGVKQALPLATRRSQPDGWAYFEGLPPGRELNVSATAPDAEPSLPEPFRIEPGGEARIDPLRIARPATLTVEPQLAREFRERFPKSHIEMIVLDAVDSAAEQRRESAGEREQITFERMRPGRWLVTALVATGTSMQPLRGPEIEVKPGDALKIEPMFTPLVFRGRVTSGGRPVEGNIDIRGSRRTDPLPSVALSKTGEFEAILERRGTYEVDVRVRPPARMIWIGDVAFDDPAQPIEIALPAGAIALTVRAEGKAVANASASARMQRDASEGVHRFDLIPVKTNAGGAATLNDLLPGTWVVSVQDESGRVAEKSVTVAGKDPVPVTIELREPPAIRGRVTESFGAPVPAARVTCIVPGADGLPSTSAALTSEDGTFSIPRQPSGRGPVLCGVSSFSGVQAYRVNPGTDAELVLPAETASLQLVSLPPLHRLSTLWLASPDGRLAEVSEYVRGTAASPVLSIPAMAAGRWKLVRVSSLGEWLALTNGGGMLTPLAEVSLNPGDRQRLEVSP